VIAFNLAVIVFNIQIKHLIVVVAMRKKKLELFILIMKTPGKNYQ